MTQSTELFDAKNSTKFEPTGKLTWFRWLKVRRATWWTWLAISVCLLWGLTGDEVARQIAMTISVLQAIVFLGATGSLRQFPTQLRFAYVLWMAASFVPELTFMYWIQTAGTTSLILFGYCPLARMLLFFPWNRTVPLNWKRVFIIAFHPPIEGSVKTGLPL